MHDAPAVECPMATNRHDTPKERHRPPHFPGDGDLLFVTAATHRRYPHLRPSHRKAAFRDLLRVTTLEYAVELVAWVILDEHYHVVVRPERGSTLPAWVKCLHIRSSDFWNEEDRTLPRQGWYQYWDTTLHTEGDLWSRINYIHGNPVKHGYVEDPYAWQWSSLREFDPVLEDPQQVARRDRFKAPMKLPGDDF